VCRHPDSAVIDGALGARQPSLGVLSRRYGMSKQALMRHRDNHLTPNLALLTRAEVAAGNARTVYDQLAENVERLELIYEATRQSRNAHLAILSLREKRGQLELMAKINGELRETPAVAVNIVQSPEFAEALGIVLEELRSHPALRERIGHRMRVLEGRTTS